jgi:hypothetical protein
MGLHRSLLAAAAAALALAAVPAVAANKKGFFGRIAQETGAGAADAAATTFAAAAGNGAAGVGDALGKVMESFEEKQWKLAERAFDGDMLGVLRDTMLTNKQHVEELTQAWSDPRIFTYLYDNLPFFKAIKPIRALREGIQNKMEGQTGWTAQQVRYAWLAGLGWTSEIYLSLPSFSCPQPR